uniref:Uncharacterized protein n=1 Tax=Anopheles albimanus TaxID=7167 RepID=A0A182FZG0_ANOAL
MVESGLKQLFVGQPLALWRNPSFVRIQGCTKELKPRA